MNPRITGIDLVRIIEAAGLTARSYSGRGMYGRQCVGVELDGDASVFSLAIDMATAVADADGDPSDLAWLKSRTDSMGLGMIVYFPEVAWPTEEDLDDEFETDARASVEAS